MIRRYKLPVISVGDAAPAEGDQKVRASSYTVKHAHNSFLLSCSLVVSAKMVIGEQKEDYYFGYLNKNRLHRLRK